MLTILSTLWSKGYLPYVAIAALALGLYLEHARLAECQAEKSSIQTSLTAATGANQSDAATIAELQSAQATLTKQLDQEKSDAATAAAKASQKDRALAQALSGAQQSLSQLAKNPAYEKFLGTDVDALYPQLAAGLRSIGAAGSH